MRLLRLLAVLLFFGLPIVLLVAVMNNELEIKTEKMFSKSHPVLELGVVAFVMVAADYTKQDDNYEKKMNELIDNARTLTINFYAEEDKDSTTLAWCNYLTNEIGVNANTFMYLSVNQQMMLMFHELAHCLLDRRHSDYGTDWLENVLLFLRIIPKRGFFEDGCPKSLMHPYIMGDICWLRHHEEYLVELFN